MGIIEAKVLRLRLGSSPVRLAVFKIVTSENQEPLNRTVELFHDHDLLKEAGMLLEWRIKHELGSLTFAQVRF